MKVTYEGKYIVLLGATGGIGQALAQQLAESGANLLLVARNAQRLEQLIKLLPGTKHQYCAANLANEEGRKQIIQMVNACLNINSIIFSTGINDFRWLEEQSNTKISELIMTNLTAVILLTHALLPYVKTHKVQLAYIGSTYGVIGYPGFATYCASKFGLRGFAQALGRELRNEGVKVKYIAPRATDTSLNDTAIRQLINTTNSQLDTPEQVAQQIIQALSSNKAEWFIGWPEKLFVKVNQLFPALVSRVIHKQWSIIRRCAERPIG
ncbi:SDR family oxidoreductase [Spartinivicinus ruber]|uniref:SDR family oxidoreductase n=1 Tax=Spartinivicinus ruber TaxID=2683272 RepID=UPI0013D10085|nr:SDR family oxidoreductase [Spartinivicinus ruber]